MPAYLITDACSGDKQWVAAATVREALIARENELRAAGGPGRYKLPPLPATAKASYDDSGFVDVQIADVYCRGRRESVIR